MLQKFSKFVLVFFVMMGILAPSFVSIFDYSFGIQKNIVYAQTPDPYASYKGLFKDTTLKLIEVGGTSAKVQLHIIANDKTQPVYDYEKTDKGEDGSFVLAIFQINSDGTQTEMVSSEVSALILKDIIANQYPVSTGIDDKGQPSGGNYAIGGLTKSSKYIAQMYFRADGDDDSEDNGRSIAGSKNLEYYPFGQPLKIDTTDGKIEKVDDPGNVATDYGNAGEPMMGACAIAGIGQTDGDIMGCISTIIYYLVWWPSSALFGLSGMMLNYTMAYTIDSNSYKDMSFVTSGWKLVRDISNIFFILILIYAGILTIFTGFAAGTKKTIFMVVIVGVLINFSLFFTQVIIDVGNILARTIYFNIQPEHADGSKIKDMYYGGVAYKPLTEIFVGKINPQQLIQQAQTFNSTDIKANTITNNAPEPLGNGSFILILLLASAINIVGLIVFFSVSLFLIGRVVRLWFMMIFSPLAFISLALPKGTLKLGQFEYSKWLSELLGLSFLAPVFVFFIYIIILFLDADFLKINTNVSGGGLNFLMGIIIPFVFIAIMLMKSKTIAKNMAGEIAGQVVTGLNMVAGAAVGSAAGGAGLLGRATFGAVGSKIANSTYLKDTAAKGGMSGWLAEKALKGGDYAGKSSFDARKTKLGTTFQKETGANLNPAGMGMLNLDTKSGDGGYVGVRQRKVDEYTKQQKKLEVSDEEWMGMSEKQKQKHYATASENALKKENADRAKNSKPAMSETEATAFKEKERAAAEKKGKATVNANRKEAFVESLKTSANSNPVLKYTVGHLVSKGSIDMSAKILAANKMTTETTNKDKDQAKLDKIDKELLKINGDPNAPDGSKEKLGQEKVLEENLKKVTESLDKLSTKLTDETALDSKTNMGGIGRHKKGTDEENIEEEIKHRQGNSNTAKAELMSAQAKYDSSKTTTNLTALTEAATKFETRKQELDEIKDIMNKKEKLDKQKEAIIEKQDKLEITKIDLEGRKDAILGKSSDKDKDKKKEPEEPKK